MGTVYAADDLELQRRVALKVLAAPRITEEARERMLREARILARLEHPGIVPVHDVLILPDGRVAYAMKLVQGERLDAHAGRFRGLRERLRIFERICEAVAFAHAQGVIHRDLKPGNIMVGSFGEVLVLDWGVAKILGSGEPGSEQASTAPGELLPEESGRSVEDAITRTRPPGDETAGRTRPGTVLGTPGFMSPEQRAGRLELVDGRADVYALGVILEQLIGDATEPAPRRLRALVAKALAPLDSRYRGVEEMASDVSRFLDDAPVSAYRENPFEAAGRFVRRYRGPIALLVTYLVVRWLMFVFAGA
jgi:serine/threonine protein kinase